jgi:hypothetical protein
VAGYNEKSKIGSGFSPSELARMERQKARAIAAANKKKKDNKTTKEDKNTNTGNAVDRMVKAAAPSAKPTPEKKATAKKAVFGQGNQKTVNGKANVTAEQLKKTGMSLRKYMNEWNRTGKRPTKALDGGKPKNMTFDPEHRATMKSGLRKGNVPSKPRPGDFPNASAYKRAADRWNLKYGKGSAKATGTPQKIEKVQVDPNKRVTQRATRAAAATLGPISLAVGGAAVTGAARVAAAAARSAKRITAAEENFRKGLLTKGELNAIKAENKLTNVSSEARKIVNAAKEARDLAATTTRVGVTKGRRSGEAIRNRKSGRLSGIPKRTQERGKKIRRGAGAVAAAGAAAGAANKAEERKGRSGRNRRR